MRRFAALFDALDASTATGDKLAALGRYFATAPAADAAWAVYFLAGGKPRQVVPTARLRQVACAIAGLDDWLFDECHQAVGDLAETIAHVLPPPSADDDAGLAEWVEQRLLPLRGLSPDEQALRLRQAFERLDGSGRFLLVKLIGGGFRVGVSRLLVQRALAAHAGLDARVVAQRLMGWTDGRARIDAARYQALLAPEGEGGGAPGQPYPFFLAHALPEGQGPPQPQGWLVEWKYDGMRAQLVRRAGGCWVWSRGEELVGERFPEVEAAARALPDGCVLDGELLVWRSGEPAPESFGTLQRRLNRKTVGRKLLAEAPVVFVAYDLLELAGQDWRERPQHQRRAALESLAPLQAAGVLRLSPLLAAADTTALQGLREQARARGAEGLMLKQHDARYGDGRTRSGGTWWKWKLDPYRVDAVLIYAQAGHGRRAGVYTDYTFALWSRRPGSADEAAAVVEAIAARQPAQPGALQLVPFAKAYSGLSDAEFARVDREIRAHTLEKFGPVRSVRPTLVFELGFEGLNRSTRHKSGVSVRFPRMLRIRSDKPLHEADDLPGLVALLGGA